MEEEHHTSGVKSSSYSEIKYLWSKWKWIIVAQSCLTLCDPVDCSTPGSLTLTISRSLPKFMSTASAMPSSHLTLWRPLLLLPSIVPSIRDFSNEMASHQMIKTLEFQLQHQSFQQAFKVDFPWDWLVWSCRPRDSQESSPAPQCEGISSLALCLLYGPALKIIHDHWKGPQPWLE